MLVAFWLSWKLLQHLSTKDNETNLCLGDNCDSNLKVHALYRANELQIFCPGHKNVSDFIQKLFVSATNVSQFAQPKKHHGQQCVQVYQGLIASYIARSYYTLKGPGSSFVLFPAIAVKNRQENLAALTIWSRHVTTSTREPTASTWISTDIWLTYWTWGLAVRAGSLAWVTPLFY